MIDLNLDEHEQEPVEVTPSHLGVIGVGQAGINILDQLVMHGPVSVEALAIDTDQGVIEGSVAGEKLLFGARIARGLGCTGDSNRGVQIWKAEAAAMDSFLRGRRELIILAGLGGGTGSAFALEAARMARSLGMKILMGAPNVVRGVSHTGNVSALELAREGLLDILSSDYAPLSVLHAVFALHRKLGLPLPEAAAMASDSPVLLRAVARLSR